MRSPLADMVRMCTTSERDSLGTWRSAPLSPALLHSAEFSSVNTCNVERKRRVGRGRGEDLCCVKGRAGIADLLMFRGKEG